MDSFLNANSFFIIIGLSIVILVSAKRKFDPLKKLRYTTTYYYYNRSLFLYVLLKIAFFLILSFSIEIIKNNFFSGVENSPLSLQRIHLGNSQAVIVASYIVIFFLENIPYLSGLDENIIHFLRQFGFIPAELKALSHSLKVSNFSFPQSFELEYKSHLERIGNTPDTIFKFLGISKDHWSRNFILISVLDKWGKSQKFLYFRYLHDDEFRKIFNAYDQLQRRFLDYTTNSGISSTLLDSHKLDSFEINVLLKHCNYQQQFEELYSQARLLFVKGVLFLGKFDFERKKILAKYGFTPPESLFSIKKKAAISATNYLSLFIIFFSISVLFSVLFENKIRITNCVAFSFSFLVSIIVAVLHTKRFHLLKHDAGNLRISVSYVLSGLISCMFWYLLFFPQFYNINHFNNGTHSGDFYHYLLSFLGGIFCFLTAFFCNVYSKRLSITSGIKNRLTEGFLMSLSFLVLFSCLYIASQLNAFEPILLKRIFHILFLFTACAFATGYIVPTWFRNSVSPWEDEREVKSNPFIVGSPVFDTKKFFGRKDIIKRILQSLHSNHFYIRGSRRSGKTSLISSLARELEFIETGSDIYHPISIDLQSISEKTLFSSIGNQLIDSIQNLHERIGDKNNNIEDIHKIKYRYFDHVINSNELSTIFFELTEAINPWSTKRIILVFLIDEFEKMNDFQLETRENFRSLFMSYGVENFRLVATGGLLKIWDRSSPFNFMKEINLGPLAKTDAKKLILETSNGIISWEESALELITELTNCEPYVIQQICSDITEYAIKNRLRNIDVDVIKKITIPVVQGR